MIEVQVWKVMKALQTVKDNELEVINEIGEAPSGGFTIAMSVEVSDTSSAPKYFGVDTKTSNVFIGVNCKNIDIYHKMREELLSLHLNEEPFLKVGFPIDSIIVNGPTPEFSEAKEGNYKFRVQLIIDWNRPPSSN